MVREDVYNAIFALLAPLTTGKEPLVLTTSRRLAHIEDVAPETMPAVYQTQIDETPTQDVLAGGVGTQITLQWYVYVGATDPQSTAALSSQLNPIVDAVLGLLPSVANPLVIQIDNQTCNFRRGKVQYFEGLLGVKAVAKVEIVVTVPFA